MPRRAGGRGPAPPLGPASGRGLTPTAGSVIRKANTLPPRCLAEDGPRRRGVTQAPQRVVDPAGALEGPAGLTRRTHWGEPDAADSILEGPDGRHVSRMPSCAPTPRGLACPGRIPRPALCPAPQPHVGSG